MNTAKNINNLYVLPGGFYQPVQEDYSVDSVMIPADAKRELKGEHKATPIKKIEDINKVIDYLQGKEKWRDLCIFVLGINVGLRCSDLMSLKVCDVLDETGHIVDEVQLVEKKTANTKGRKKNYIDLNALIDHCDDKEQMMSLIQDQVLAAQDYKANKKSPKVKKIFLNVPAKTAIKQLLEHKEFEYDDYLFTNESSNSVTGNSVPLQVKSVERILKRIIKAVGLQDEVHASTHMLRKTFGYHFYMQNRHDPRGLKKLQKVFNHSSEATTLEYIGITGEEIQQAYRELALGNVSI